MRYVLAALGLLGLLILVPLLGAFFGYRPTEADATFSGIVCLLIVATVFLYWALKP